MAYTATDLANIDEAIRAIIAGTGIVSFSVGDKTVQYTAAKLHELQALRTEISMEVGMAAGSYASRTYAKQGGRGQ